MGYRCAVIVCQNHIPRTRSTDKSIKYYPFPKNPEIRSKWIAACQRLEEFSPDNSFICSEHFAQTDYERDLKAELLNLPPKRILKPDVIPTLNLTKNIKTIEDTSNVLRKRKTLETSNVNKENKENLGKSDSNGFVISYLGVPRLLITPSHSKNTDESKTSSEGSQSRIISVDPEYASDIKSSLGQEHDFNQIEHLNESLPDKKVFKLDELCRLCGSYSNRMKPIFDQHQINYYELICNHFPDIKIHKDDILPLKICSRCETNLISLHQFFKTCNAVNKRFQSIVKKLSAPIEPAVISKDNQTKSKPKPYPEPMEVPFENADADEIVYGDDSIGEIEIVELSPEVEETDTVDVFPEEKIENVAEVIQEEIVEKIEPIGHIESKDSVQGLFEEPPHNDIKTDIRIEVKEETVGLVEPESNTKLPRVRIKNRETLKAASARRRRRRRLPTLNLRRMCHICGKIFKYPESLRRHLKTVHSDERPFKCHLCTSSFNRNHNLTIHIKVVHQHQRVYVKKHVQHLCDYCGKVLLSARSLEEHISSIHTKKALYECDKCHSTFYRKLGYDKHRSTDECDSANPIKCNAPRNEEVFLKYCEFCGLEFKKEHFYTKHKLKHLTSHTCPVCSMKFEEGNLLKEHIDAEHPEMKPFECEICGKKFKNKPLLNCHLIIHTGEKRYQCQYCSLKFLKKKYLSTHILTHTGERPFVCTICGKGFKQSGDMRKHKALHIRRQI